MFSIRSLIINTALSALFLASSASAASRSQADDETAKLAAAAPPMKVGALEKLYTNRTWRWKTGAGFFSAEKNASGFFSTGGNRFAAWSRQGVVWSYGEGSWYATRGGKLCLRAAWTSKGRRDSAVTCFLHREKDGVIYQKRSLGAKWYVFRHNPLRQDDEASKLVWGDRVSEELARMKANRR